MTELSTSLSTTSHQESEDGVNRLSKEYLKKLFAKDWKLYYRTFELNERLYLHYKGF